MIWLPCFVLAVRASPFKSKLRLEAENAVLRHQLNVFRRGLHGRVWLTNNERWFIVQMYRWFPSFLKVVTIVQPETLVRWHRAGFRRYWHWKSNSPGRRRRIEMELRVLIRRMSTENQLWGTPRINRLSTWSSDVDLQVRDGGPFCETTLRTVPPWICLWSRPLALNCCMAS
jgi:hypothetical protein